jgi:hypothetical protein
LLQIDARWTVVCACLAREAEVENFPGCLFAMEKSGEDKANGTDVYVTENMASNHFVRRAYVSATSAADTLKRLLEGGVLKIFQTAVVEKNIVCFLETVLALA